MSAHLVCDCCGEKIESGEPFVTLTATRSYAAAEDHRFVEHYHGRGLDEEYDADRNMSCADRMDRAAHITKAAFRTMLAPVETVSPQKLAAIRRKHVGKEGQA